ncbi:hypothetical protein H0A66_18565 [Alcaligenaceae bacterium]|nr:hypothetical protein [Alcaligenaceae bacterium]
MRQSVSYNFEYDLVLSNQVLEFDQALDLCPAIQDIKRELVTYGAPDATATGLAYETKNLSGLKLDRVGRCALVLALPCELEPLLGELIDQAPRLINIETQDLLVCTSVAMWSVDERANIVVDLNDMGHIADRCRPWYAKSWRPVRVPIPIIMMAGNSVALGGLVLSSDWEEDFSEQQSSAGKNWQPYQVFDERTINNAIEWAHDHGGPSPFINKLWSPGEGCTPLAYIPISFKAYSNPS